MKKHTAITPVFAGLLSFLSAFLLPAAPGSAAEKRQGVEVSTNLDAGMLEAKEVKLLFPSPMIPEESIGGEQATSPVEWTPALAGKWVWQSQTEGTFTTGKGVRPDTQYLLRLPGGQRLTVYRQNRAVGEREHHIGENLTVVFNPQSASLLAE